MRAIEKNSEIRIEIDEIISKNEAKEQINPLHDLSRGRITLIKEPDFNKEDCADYVLGTEREGLSVKEFLEKIAKEVKNPLKGDIIAYRYSYCEKWTPHIGIYQEEGSIMSKWGPGGPIFLHPEDHVPTIYGDRIKFYRKNHLYTAVGSSNSL